MQTKFARNPIQRLILCQEITGQVCLRLTAMGVAVAPDHRTPEQHIGDRFEEMTSVLDGNFRLVRKSAILHTAEPYCRARTKDVMTETCFTALQHFDAAAFAMALLNTLQAVCSFVSVSPHLGGAGHDRRRQFFANATSSSSYLGAFIKALAQIAKETATGTLSFPIFCFRQEATEDDPSQGANGGRAKQNVKIGARLKQKTKRTERIPPELELMAKYAENISIVSAALAELLHKSESCLRSAMSALDDDQPSDSLQEVIKAVRELQGTLGVVDQGLLSAEVLFTVIPDFLKVLKQLGEESLAGLLQKLAE